MSQGVLRHTLIPSQNNPSTAALATLWMGCFEEELQKCLRGVIRHPFFILFLKRWPKGIVSPTIVLFYEGCIIVIYQSVGYN